MTDREKLVLAIDTLKEIVDPIKVMKESLKEGETLNGMMAIQISNDSNYLKNIAITTLKKLKEIK